MIPEGWTLEDLQSVATTFAGGTPSRQNEDYFKGNIPWVKSGEVNKTIISDTEEKITSEALKNSSAKIAPKGSVLVAMYGATAGVIGKLAIDAAINQAVLSVNAKSERAINEYLFYVLANLSKDLLNTVQGSGQPNLSKYLVDNASIVLPSLPEQKRIAEVLGGVDAAIEATKEVIEQTKKVKQGLLQTLLTRGIGHTRFKPSQLGEIPVEWNVVRIGEVCDSLVPGRNKPKSFDGDIPWITTGDIDSNYITVSKQGLGVSKDALSEVGTKIIPKDSVVMTCLGKFGVTSITKNEVLINQQLHAFVCGNKITPQYLSNSIRNQKENIEKLGAATTVAYLNKAQCESILITLPPLSEQKAIAEIFEGVDTQLTAERDKLASLHQLKKGLMHDLLTGKVRVHG